MNQALQVEYTRNCILHRGLSSDFKMSIQSVIEEKIGVRFKPHHLLINNERNLHSDPSTEYQFKLTVVSDSEDREIPPAALRSCSLQAL